MPRRHRVSMSPAPLPRSGTALTVAGADCEADALAGTVEHDVETLHDDGAHDGARGGLGDGELVAVVLRGGHVLHRPQVLLQGQRWRQGRGRAALPTQHGLGSGQGPAGLALTWGRMVIRNDWLVASPIR